MATISLRISIPEKNVIKMMQFDPSITVHHACEVIKDKLVEHEISGLIATDYGLFLPSEDVRKGVWLESDRNLDYYILRNGDLLEYKRKSRTLRVRMLDGALKTVLVDDSQTVANLMVVICTKIGITNHDEYSLVRELPEDENDGHKKDNFGTLTLRRKKDDKGEKNSKMDQLKKKLKTDDEVNWIDPSKTLREQGIPESETVLLRRKFFFSDQNIDGRDPVQLSLLYVQARDAILDGTHPIVLEQACAFAGIQCQIQFGDHKEDKHKSGFLDLKEFLPQSYLKIKGVEKKIFAEHKKHRGLSESEAKVLYTKTARSLSTYGVTFFLVKEKLRGKNKLVPRLLGVTKDSVLRLDEKTKEILKTWPLTTVRRWGASPNTFTLDFGDYSDQYYSVQTTEAEQILQLISGYIDIILKKQKAKDHFGIEGDEESSMVEDSVSPVRATIMQHESKRVERRNVNSHSVAVPSIMSELSGAQYTTTSRQANMVYPPGTMTAPPSYMSQPQRAALESTIISGREIIETAEMELSRRTMFPEIGKDNASIKWREQTIDTHKQNIGSQMAAMNAAVAQVVTLTSKTYEEVDHDAVGAAITTITSNLPEVTKGVSMIAALIDDESTGDRLLDAARKLCLAFSDLLKATEPETKEPRQSLLNAVTRIGEASQQVLTTMRPEDETQQEQQDVLLSLAKSVAKSTAALVLKAKNIAFQCEDSALQNNVIGCATNCAFSTSQLVACTKVVAPTLDSPACQTQLITAIREVTKAVEQLVQVCDSECTNEVSLKELSQAAANVTKVLNDLLMQVKLASRNEGTDEPDQEKYVETILMATNKLFSMPNETEEIIRQTRIVGQATAQLIQSIKSDVGKQNDSEHQQKLLIAAKALADATAKMVEAARQCASAPQDTKRHDNLREAVEELREATTVAALPAIKGSLISKLRTNSKLAASAAAQCAAAVSGVTKFNMNSATQRDLNENCQNMMQHIPTLITEIKNTYSKPHSSSAQLNLINASEDFSLSCVTVLKAIKSTLPTTSDNASIIYLKDSSLYLGSALTDLKSVVTRSKEVFTGLEFEAADEMLTNLRTELQDLNEAMKTNSLKPLPEETSESTSIKFGSASKMIEFTMAKLLSACKQNNEVFIKRTTNEFADNMKEFVSSVRGVIATNESYVQGEILNNAFDVLNLSDKLLKQAKNCSENYNEQDFEHLTHISKEVIHSLDTCVSSLPNQRDLNDAIGHIQHLSDTFESEVPPPSDKSLGQLQSELSASAVRLNDISAQFLNYVQNPNELSFATKLYLQALNGTLETVKEIQQRTPQEVQPQVVHSVQNICKNSIQLFSLTKSIAMDRQTPNAKNQLTAASRNVTDSINQLIDICSSSTVGQIECDNSIRNIQSMLPLLNNPNEPISDATYFECLDDIIEKSKILGDGMTGIANHAKNTEHDKFTDSIKNVSDSICGLIQAAAQAAYLAGVSDVSSAFGKPGLIDQSHIFRAANAIQVQCQTFENSIYTQEQLLTVATLIAKHTSSLCNACRVASNKTKNPVAKRYFVQSAKDIASSTAVLVKEIKNQYPGESESNRRDRYEKTKPLLEAIDNLCAFVRSPEFVSQPTQISSEGKIVQKPIINAAQSIIDSSCAMISSAKSLAVTPKDPPTWQLLANHSKNVSDSIKSLVSSIRDKAPGQRECDSAIQSITQRIHEIDTAAMNVISQSYIPHTKNTIESFIDMIKNSSCELHEKLVFLCTSAKFETQNIGHSVTQVTLYSEPLISSGIKLAFSLKQQKQQIQLLDQIKTVAESILQLIYVSKETGGNPRAKNLHSNLDETVNTAHESLNDLEKTVESISITNGATSGLVDAITQSLLALEDHEILDSENVDSLGNYQSIMIDSCKEISRIASKISTNLDNKGTDLTSLAAHLSQNYCKLANSGRHIFAVLSNEHTLTKLRLIVQEVGKSCIDIVQSIGRCEMQSGDFYFHQEIRESCKNVTEKIGQILSVLQIGSQGTQACINAASTVSGIIGDLDTIILFATAGTLCADRENERFSDHRENILKSAKALVEDTKTLVAGAASSQEQLAVAAQNAVSTIIHLSEMVKHGAASLGSNNTEAQVMLINAVRDVASALGDLIHATKGASGKLINDPSMTHLKDSAKVMVSNVTSLLKTVKAVEDEHTCGNRALESTIEAIAQELQFPSTSSTLDDITPEDLIKCTKNITTCTAKTVAAGNSCKQEDIIAAANMGRRLINELFMIYKTTLKCYPESDEIRDRLSSATYNIATNYKELLELVLQISTRSGDRKHLLLPASKKISQNVTELVAVAQMMSSNGLLDLNNPYDLAENELLGAAASIDTAAKKLQGLQPRKSFQASSTEEFSYDEIILDAAKSIAAATSDLIKAASIAQMELMLAGRIAKNPVTNSDDGQWSEGLISAARLVAAATHSLVDSANTLVQGFGSEEKLISSAKQVASSTAQLLVACKVKSDADSASMKVLQAAGSDIKRATDNLVRTAQQAIQHEEERSLILNRRIVGGIAQEINARSEVLRIEKELEEARGRLTAIRQAKYKNKNEQSENDDSVIMESNTPPQMPRIYKNRSAVPAYLIHSFFNIIHCSDRFNKNIVFKIKFCNSTFPRLGLKRELKQLVIVKQITY
ncbi:unnamed protein product [Trichogramma brassicae]|uniref:FERM domain-containing protein n=1 Tax=Trichogramma brassicae TaxID=86971 RepID=A0A6H5I8T5_9HYME|nr:unnamed protein product [Trichogramma brassicae]